MAENVGARARRLLTEGRVRVLDACEDDGFVSATVRGDSGSEWSAGYEDGDWRCDCPAAGFERRCTHIRSLQLIFVMSPRRSSR